MKNRKGFTLIELLAVVIILGILMIIAVPAVSQYIDDSKKNSYISSAKHLGGGARNIVNSGKYDLTDPNTTYYLDVSCINSENDLQSPYADYEKAYVAVTFNDDHYEYFWTSVDKAGIGVKDLTEINKLGIDNIVTNIDPNDILPDIGIDGREYVVTILGSACTKSDPQPAERKMNSSTGKIKPANVAVSDTIYWALQNPDSNNHYQRLLISDSPVEGEESGSFAGNQKFDDYYSVPWNGSNLKASYVTDIKIEGTVAPTNLDYWFATVAKESTAINQNIKDIDTSNVTSMSYTFYNFGYRVTSFNLNLNDWDVTHVKRFQTTFFYTGAGSNTFNLDIRYWDVSKAEAFSDLFQYTGANSQHFTLDLTRWDVSNVKYMDAMFYGAGAYSTTVALDLSNWDTRNVELMSFMFEDFASNASEIDLKISNFNTSKVISMSRMFEGFGRNLTNFTLDINNWDTSNVEEMDSMFEYAAYYSQNVNLNIGDWNTSKVSDSQRMFYNFARNVYNFNLNLSKWNTSNISNMEDMFSYTAYFHDDYSVIIPRTNGNGLDNTSYRMYGKNSSTYTSCDRMDFTLASN